MNLQISFLDFLIQMVFFQTTFESLLRCYFYSEIHLIFFVFEEFGFFPYLIRNFLLCFLVWMWEGNSLFAWLGLILPSSISFYQRFLRFLIFLIKIFYFRIFFGPFYYCYYHLTLIWFLFRRMIS